MISGLVLWIRASDDALADLNTDRLAARAGSALRVTVSPWRRPTCHVWWPGRLACEPAPEREIEAGEPAAVR